MGDTVKKTGKYWNEQYHETLLLFPDELRGSDEGNGMD